MSLNDFDAEAMNFAGTIDVGINKGMKNDGRIAQKNVRGEKPTSKHGGLAKALSRRFFEYASLQPVRTNSPWVCLCVYQ